MEATAKTSSFDKKSKHETSVVDVGNLAEAALKLNGIFDAARA